MMWEDWDEYEESENRAAAIEAINQIRRGAYVDAITTLERHFLPMWDDAAECEAAYREAMGR